MNRFIVSVFCVCLIILHSSAVMAVPAPPTTPGDPDSIFAITILSPVENARFSLGSVTLEYRHNSDQTLFCLAAMDSVSWTENDPRWTDAMLTRDAQVQPGQTNEEVFSAVPSGSHTFEIMCENDAGTLLLHSLRSFVVTGTDVGEASLSIRPSSLLPGETVTISAEDVYGELAVIVILSPNGEEEQFDVPVQNGFEHSYSLPASAMAGEYLVDVYDENGDFLSGAFTVTRSQPALTLVSINPKVGDSVSVRGSGFAPLTSIFLGTVGPEYDETKNLVADAQGVVTITYPSFARSGLYTLTAIGGGAVASLEFAVEAGDFSSFPELPLPVEGDSSDLPSSPDLPQLETSLLPFPEQPSDGPLQSSSTSSNSKSWIFWTVLSLVFGLILVGSTGALVWREILPFPFLKNAMESGLHLLHRSSLPAIPQQNPQVIAQVQSFVLDERAKGYDDLTIRSALLAKGWDRATVDATFDALYKRK